MPTPDSQDRKRARPPLHVVLAEDDSDQRFLLAAMLRAEGYQVTETGDGNVLREHLDSLAPGGAEPPRNLLVVADLRLRGPDALSVLRELRAGGRSPRFILTSAYLTSHIHGEARSLGALAVFAKPFDFEDLRTVIRFFEHDGG